MFRVLTALIAESPAAGYTYTGGTGHAAGDPMLGWLMVAGVVAAVIVFAWLAVRIGDEGRPADKLPY